MRSPAARGVTAGPGSDQPMVRPAALTVAPRAPNVALRPPARANRQPPDTRRAANRGSPAAKVRDISTWAARGSAERWAPAVGADPDTGPAGAADRLGA